MTTDCRRMYEYTCPNCGQRFPEETVAKGFFCCTPQCEKRFRQRNPLWIVGNVIGAFFEGECPRPLKAGTWNRKEKDPRGEHYTEDTAEALAQIGRLNHAARQWGYRFTEEEHKRIADRHPQSGMHPERLERLRMIRDGEGMTCRNCGASIGLYDELTCPACGEDS